MTREGKRSVWLIGACLLIYLGGVGAWMLPIYGAVVAVVGGFIIARVVAGLELELDRR